MYHGDVPPLGGDPVTRVGTARVDHAVTSGTFSLDGETFEVANNVWVVGDDAECVVIDAPHSVEENPRYIVDLIKRVTTVSVETVKIVEGLPQLGL